MSSPTTGTTCLLSSLHPPPLVPPYLVIWCHLLHLGLFSIILSALYPPSPNVTSRGNPPPLVPGGTPGPFSVPYPWAGALRNKAKASLCISLSRAPISRAWASEAPLTPVLARYLEQQMAPTLCVCPEP